MKKENELVRKTANRPVEAARAVLERFGVKSAPVPLEKIARGMGASLRFSPLDDELSGMIYVKDDVPIIGVNALHHPNRQRFTIAHEIGHLELHKEHITATVHVDKQFSMPILMRNQASATGTDDIEIQANRFAAELLMPLAIFEEALAQSSTDFEDDAPIEKLAKKFKVSRQAVEYRIRNLPPGN